MKKKLVAFIESQIDLESDILKASGYDGYPTCCESWVDNKDAYARVRLIQALVNCAREMGVKLKYDWF